MTLEYTEPGATTPVSIPSIARAPKPALGELVSDALTRAEEFLFSVQREDARWCAELESNPTITSEYVLLTQILKLDLGGKREKLARYLLGQQNKDGGWGIARDWKSDVSTAIEAYFALRVLGLEIEDEPMRRAEAYIRSNGGIEKSRVFTRIFLAMFGLFPWEAIPVIPPEFIFFPSVSPVNIYALSSWARGTMVPLFVIFHHQPIFELPNGKSAENTWLDHLWLNPSDKRVPYAPPLPSLVARNGISWTSFFGLGDALLRIYDRVHLPALRKRAVERCTRWILDRQEPSGDWAGIFPPMLNGIIALYLQGYALDSEPIRKGLEAIDRFAWEDSEGVRIQACVSPVWDTVLSAIALIDSGTNPADPRLKKALGWVVDHQLLVEHGDWRVYRPNLQAGGWSFEYFNSWYPDIDDTAAVVIALLKQDPSMATSDTVIKAVTWMIGMQNADGGFAAFDVNNDKLFLNRIPFSDMDSLCDPSSPDVAGRVIEALGLWLEILKKEPKGSRRAADLSGLRAEATHSARRGVAYLRRTQETEGSWFGRWGVNYIYGTSNALCGLVRAGVPASDRGVQKAVEWLKSVQNPDGGWGEALETYADSSLMGRGAASTASQTAWALMGLLAYVPPATPEVERGVRWLVEHQVKARAFPAREGGHPVPEARGGTWNEEAFTGTGFPNHFYLRYHYYRHYFPMMALGRYLKGITN